MQKENDKQIKCLDIFYNYDIDIERIRIDLNLDI